MRNTILIVLSGSSRKILISEIHDHEPLHYHIFDNYIIFLLMIVQDRKRVREYPGRKKKSIP